MATTAQEAGRGMRVPLPCVSFCNLVLRLVFSLPAYPTSETRRAECSAQLLPLARVTRFRVHRAGHARSGQAAARASNSVKNGLNSSSVCEHWANSATLSRFIC